MIEVDTNALRQSLNVLSEQIATVLITVLNKEIEVQITKVEAANKDEIAAALEGNGLEVKSNLAEGANGPLSLLFTKKYLQQE